MASKADICLGILLDRDTEALCSPVRATALQQNVQAKSFDNLKLPTVVLFVESNTTMALAILTEQRDFVGAGVGQSSWCEIAQGDQSFSVTPCSLADTA